MPSTYSTNLAIELMATGEKTGLWGTVLNTSVGTLIEEAISGYTTQAITDGADTTITIPNGVTGVARHMCIEMTGALSATRNLVVPANKKLYFIYNNTTGGYAVTVLVSGQTGVSVPNGAKTVLVCDGTDVVDATSYVSAMTLGAALGVASGGTGAATLADGGLVIGNGTSAVEVVAAGATTEILVGGGAGTAPVWTTATGSGAPVRATSPTFVTPVLGTPASGDLSNCTGLGFASGTRAFFQQTSAPTGWTKGAVYDDYALRLTTGSVSTAGTYAFTTSFGAGQTTGSTAADLAAHTHTMSFTSGAEASHTHTAGSLAAASGGVDHTHSYTSPLGGAGGYSFSGGSTIYSASTTGTASAYLHTHTISGTSSAGSSHTHAVSGTSDSTGAGGGHTHTMANLAVKYLDCIVAEKD